MFLSPIKIYEKENLKNSLTSEKRNSKVEESEGG
jgi:hypothetical protein